MTYAKKHLKETSLIIKKIDYKIIENIADLLVNIKSKGGRVFFFRCWW